MPVLSYSSPGKRIARVLLILVAVVVVFVAAFFAAKAFLGFSLFEDDSEYGEGGSPASASVFYRSPYDWANLTWENGIPTYTVDGKVSSMFGVDVSTHDGAFDWETAAADGVEFAYIRLGWRGYTEGGLNVDDQFAANYAGARSQGLKVGVYFFSCAITPDEAREEADLVIDELASAGATLDLPIAFDFERIGSPDARTNHLKRAEVAAIANAFCERLEEAGYETIIYGNQRDLAFYQESVTDDRRVWLAEYDTNHPTAQFDFCMWQFTSTGQLDGIGRNVDLDILFLNTF